MSINDVSILGRIPKPIDFRKTRTGTPWAAMMVETYKRKLDPITHQPAVHTDTHLVHVYDESSLLHLETAKVGNWIRIKGELAYLNDRTAYVLVPKQHGSAIVSPYFGSDIGPTVIPGTETAAAEPHATRAETPAAPEPEPEPVAVAEQREETVQPEKPAEQEKAPENVAETAKPEPEVKAATTAETVPPAAASAPVPVRPLARMPGGAPRPAPAAADAAKAQTPAASPAARPTSPMRPFGAMPRAVSPTPASTASGAGATSSGGVGHVPKAVPGAPLASAYKGSDDLSDSDIPF